MHVRPAALLSVLALTAGSLSALTVSAPPALAQDNPASPVFINELHYDDVGADTGELVEVAGPAGTDLSGWSVVLYNGNGGFVYGQPAALSGTLADSSGGFGFAVANVPGIQNGPVDGLALVDRGGAVVQFLSYGGGRIFANDGPARGLLSTDIAVAEDGAATPAGHSLQLTGSGNSYGDFTWAGPAEDSPGTANSGQTFTAPDGATAPAPTQERPPTRDGASSRVFVTSCTTTTPGTTPVSSSRWPARPGPTSPAGRWCSTTATRAWSTAPPPPSAGR